MSSRNLRCVSGAVVCCAWFVTMAGGWGDIEDAFGGVAQASWQRDTGTVARRARPLEGRVLAAGDLFGMPTEITATSGSLYLIDRYRDQSVVEIDRRSGKLLRAYGRPGEGPGEFKSPMSLIVEGEKVAVLDAGLNRVTWLASDGEAAFELSRITEIAAPATVTGFAPGPDRGLLLTGLLPKARLALADRAGRIQSLIGDGPDASKLPPDRLLEAFQGTLRGSPAGDRYVLTSRFASHVEIVDAPMMTESTVWGPERFEPRAGRYVARFGYLDSAPMRDGFLALYSGRTREDYPGRANYGSTIHEFGWDGQLRAVYELDADVITIAWSEEDGLLYAVRHDPVPGVVVYSLR